MYSRLQQYFKHTLGQTTRYTDATDLRDKVYALLGLFVAGNKTFNTQTHDMAILIIDYKHL
jgi:hypothetical protein